MFSSMNNSDKKASKTRLLAYAKSVQPVGKPMTVKEAEVLVDKFLEAHPQAMPLAQKRMTLDEAKAELRNATLTLRKARKECRAGGKCRCLRAGRNYEYWLLKVGTIGFR